MEPQRKYAPHKKYNLPTETDYYQHATIQQVQAINNVFGLVSKGLPVYKAIEELQQISRSEFFNILHFNPQLKDDYSRACEEREVVMFDKALEIALDGSSDWYVNEKGATVPNPVTVQRARLASDIILRMLATMNHKKYGNRLNVEANINVMNPLTTTEAEEILKEIE